MSLWGKLLLSLSGFSLVVTTLVFWILGGWYNFLYIFLFLFFASLAGALVVDFRLYLNFLMMRTTKNGMSMGMSILVTLLLCSSLSYLSVRFDKSIDVTEERINSLAPQTLQLLKNLEEDMQLKIFYKGGEGVQAKEQIKGNLVLYKKNSSRLKIRYYDAYLENKLAQEYLNEQPDKTKSFLFVFVEYKGKKVSVSSPYNEEKITAAMINVTRRDQKTVYFLSGHGERESTDKGAEGIKDFYDALSESAFNTKEWNFVTDGALPADASAVVIAGPDRPYLEKELQWLTEYLKQGGRLLLGLDPDKNHNFKDFLKQYGIQYQKHYVMMTNLSLSALMGMGPLNVLGVHFDKEHSITKSFSRGLVAVFHTASDLSVSAEQSDITELVKTSVQTASVPGLNREDLNKKKQGPHAIGLLLKQAIEKDADKDKNEDAQNKDTSSDDTEDKKSMILAVYGDSDFLSNQWFNNARVVNRDMIMNTVSYLVDASDLVSIRPKRLKATQIALKSSDQMGVILVSIILPLVFFVLSFVIWFRRRGA